MPEKITSPGNPRIKNILLLQSKSRERRSRNLVVIEGFREISRAMQSGFSLMELYYCEDLTDAGHLEELMHGIPENAAWNISLPAFDRIAYREGSDGLIAIAEPRYLQLHDLKLSDNPLVIILESVEKPGNLGAIMRTADAAGVDAVVICDLLTDLYNPNTIRSSVGCIFTCPVVVSSSADVRMWLAEKRIRPFSAALSAKAEYYHRQDFTGPTAFVMGTEATGLSAEWLGDSFQQVIIPMLGIADSLNVSASTAILVFEAMRQRNFIA